MKDNNAMMNKAKKLIVNIFNEEVDKTDNTELTIDQVYIVWFAKTLQNWKAILSTDISDGMLYEVTYNGDKKESYVDSYKKWKNKKVVD